MEFGLPLLFVEQSHIHHPPLPYEAGFATVREHPTTMRPLWFVFDVALVFRGG
jgi:hypothetical protein